MQEYIKNIFKKNNGVLKTASAYKAGINKQTLRKLSMDGEIERVSRGIYVAVDYMVDEYKLAQYRAPKGIYSHDTALYLHGLSDRTPMVLTMTIPSGYNTRLLKDKGKYKFYYNKQDIYQMGITTTETSFGSEIKVYDKERTICDCIKRRDELDSDVVLSAIKHYMDESVNDYSSLLSYAEKLKIRDSVRQYLEVLR